MSDHDTLEKLLKTNYYTLDKNIDFGSEEDDYLFYKDICDPIEGLQCYRIWVAVNYSMFPENGTADPSIDFTATLILPNNSKLNLYTRAKYVYENTHITQVEQYFTTVFESLKCIREERNA